jgi:hypothetical protein
MTLPPHIAAIQEDMIVAAERLDAALQGLCGPAVLGILHFFAGQALVKAARAGVDPDEVAKMATHFLTEGVAFERGDAAPGGGVN